MDKVKMKFIGGHFDGRVMSVARGQRSVKLPLAVRESQEDFNGNSLGKCLTALAYDVYTLRLYRFADGSTYVCMGHSSMTDDEMFRFQFAK